LDRGQARALVAAADTGPQALRTRAAVLLLPLLHNAQRVDEACTAGLADLVEDRLCPIRARTGTWKYVLTGQSCTGKRPPESLLLHGDHHAGTIARL
jgi:hypothetical protein